MTASNPRGYAVGRVALSFCVRSEHLQAVHACADSLEISSAALMRDALAHYVSSGPLSFPVEAVQTILECSAQAKSRRPANREVNIPTA